MSARAIPSRRGVYVSDADDEVLTWLQSIVDDQVRRHPGRRTTLASVAKEALAAARATPELDAKLRR